MSQAQDPFTTLLRQTQFETSAATLAQCPPEAGIEVAFAGRSNSGKSSALNTLVDHSGLARTSKTPGRTQLINFFSMNEQWKLVDLPGYGYAKVDKQTRMQWQRHLDDYLARRRCLTGLVLLMDIRHPLKDFDRLILDWSAQAGMPLHLLITKADKLKFGAAKSTLLQIRKTLKDHPAPLTAQLFSATAGTGCDEAWARLGDWLRVPPDEKPSA